MPLDENDAAYLWDMLTRARTIREFTAGVLFAQYEQDKKSQLAIERLLEVIGEAANRVSPEFRGQHPELPWRQIIGLRNVLAHEYGEIKLEAIWIVATQRVPELISFLEPFDLSPGT